MPFRVYRHLDKSIRLDEIRFLLVLVKLPPVIKEFVATVPFMKREGAASYSSVGTFLQKLFPAHSVPHFRIAPCGVVGGSGFAHTEGLAGHLVYKDAVPMASGRPQVPLATWLSTHIDPFRSSRLTVENGGSAVLKWVVHCRTGRLATLFVSSLFAHFPQGR